MNWWASHPSFLVENFYWGWREEFLKFMLISMESTLWPFYWATIEMCFCWSGGKIVEFWPSHVALVKEHEFLKWLTIDGPPIELQLLKRSFFSPMERHFCHNERRVFRNSHAPQVPGLFVKFPKKNHLEFSSRSTSICLQSGFFYVAFFVASSKGEFVNLMSFWSRVKIVQNKF